MTVYVYVLASDLSPEAAAPRTDAGKAFLDMLRRGAAPFQGDWSACIQQVEEEAALYVYVPDAPLTPEAAAQGLEALTAFLEGETDDLVLPEGYEVVEG